MGQRNTVTMVDPLVLAQKHLMESILAEAGRVVKWFLVTARTQSEVAMKVTANNAIALPSLVPVLAATFRSFVTVLRTHTVVKLTGYGRVVKSSIGGWPQPGKWA